MVLFSAGDPLSAAKLNAINAFVQKTADQTVVSSTTLVNDTHLSYAIAAPGAFLFDVVLFAASAANAAGDIQLAMSFPAGNCFWGGLSLDQGIPSGTVSSLDSGAASPATSGASPTHVAGLSAQNTMILVKGVATATAAGTLRLMWTQLTSNASATIVRAGSFMRVQQVG